MFRQILQIVFLMLLTAASFSVNAQFGNDPRREELPQSIKENLAKERIKQEKKEYDELVERGEEALKLTDELDKSFAANNILTTEDRKKLDRLEKIVKKIRADLGADDEEETSIGEDTTQLSMGNAFRVLQENVAKLVEELRKSTRYTVSVTAIKSSNLLLKVVRFMKLSR